jgi:uroporphyrinogen III methyltransferase / synthase
MKGKVYLIGAGPGDPGLLTLKGRACLAHSDVVVYDALVNMRLLDYAKSSASRLYVGKRGHHHAMEQAQINELMLRQALRGRQVARLKGGDPFLFGRGGEEAAYLHDHKVPFEVVPGVSSASGAAAYAGIPLTDRNWGSMVTMVTGHEGVGKQLGSVEWSRISRKSTLVIFMGLERLDVISERLIKHLWPEEMPVALIRWGSLPHQEILEGTLGDIAHKAKEAEMTSPVLIVIGRVVGLRKKLRWFETRPLFGKKIVITRAIDQAHEFSDLLDAAGAEVISFPTIQIQPPKSWESADAAIARLPEFEWLLFTSVHGVRAFFERLRQGNRDIRALGTLRIGAIGPKTAARLTDFGLRVDAFPDEYRAEALAQVVGEVKGARVLIARAEEAREVLPETLKARGAAVTIATVYRTVKTRGIAAGVKHRLLAREIDAVTFTSSSTVDGFMRHFDARERRRIFEHTKAAAIGPITAKTLKDYGVRPSIRAGRYTIESLAKAIISYFTK